MHAWIAAAILMTVPIDAVTTDNVETVELNTLYDDAGCETFKQLIFRDEDEQIVDWRVRKWPKLVSGHTLLFWDGDILRRVQFKMFRRTWTQDYDPEIFQREAWPVDMRRKLSDPTKNARQR